MESIHARLVSMQAFHLQLLLIVRSAISFPRCTESSASLQESDCGSMGWSYTLFIAWNILSMVRSAFHFQIALLIEFIVHFRKHVYWCGRRKLFLHLSTES